MHSFKIVTLALGLASTCALGACESDTTNAATKFADELCACKDKECVEKVTNTREQALDENVMKKLAREKPEEFAKLGARIGECTIRHLKMPELPATK